MHRPPLLTEFSRMMKKTIAFNKHIGQNCFELNILLCHAPTSTNHGTSIWCQICRLSKSLTRDNKSLTGRKCRWSSWAYRSQTSRTEGVRYPYPAIGARTGESWTIKAIGELNFRKLSDYDVVKFDSPQSWRLTSRDDNNTEVMFRMQGVLCAFELPPVRK